MGALRQPRLTEPSDLKKPPKSEGKAAPPTHLERLRGRTNYDKGEGWGALPCAAVADLMRLSAGEVCLKLILQISMGMGSGAKSVKESWESFTDFRSSEEWAACCMANVRDIQRQRDELKSRGVIAVKQIKAAGGVKYAFSLLYRKWGELEDYAVWKRRQVVAIDEAIGTDEAEDEAPVEVSKDAVILTKRPAAVRPGRASRAVKVSVGVRELSFQNDSPAVDASFHAVVTSGRLVVACSFASRLEKGEEKAMVGRHACRALPANEGSTKSETPRQKGGNGKLQLPLLPPRAAELHCIFDPLLAHSGASLLSMDGSRKYSDLACANVEDCDHDYLCKFVANRKIKSVTLVPTICAEAFASWRASQAGGVPAVQAEPAKKKSFAEGLKDEAMRRLSKYGRI